MFDGRKIVFLLAAAAAAVPALGLEIEGNEAFPAEEIEAAAGAGGPVEVETIERLYLQAGYLDVELVAEEGRPDKIVVTEGPQYRVASLEVDNASPLSRSEVEAFIPFRSGEAPALPALREGLASLLATLAERGYLRAEAEYAITEAGPGRVDVVVAVRAGEKYTAGQIGILGVDPGEVRRLREVMETRRGRPIRERELARDLLAVIDYYRARGYPEAAARPRGFEIAEAYREVDFDVNVNPGGKVTIATVDIVGNRRTRDAVIRRELRLAPGAPYDVELLKASARRIYNLKYFESEPTIEFTDVESGKLRVAVEERRTYRVTGALAYEPEQGETEAALIGEMEARLANLGGTGRELTAYYRRLTPGNMDSYFKYYEPWIGGIDLFAEPNGAYKERSTYRKAGGELALGTHPLLDLTVAAGAGFDRVWEENASRKYKVFTWARYDSRDYFDNPRRGWQAEARLELGVKVYAADGSRERVPRLGLDAWRFWPTAGRQVLAARFRARGFVARRVTSDELYGLGGHADLRGFKEEQFLTDRQALATLEYRFLAGPASRLFVFVDGAYHHLNSDKTFAEGLDVGYGGGFRAATPVGMYGVDYGLAAGEGPLDGKIHVSITQEF